MARNVAGNFTVEVWGDGYPVHCTVSYNGERICRIAHTELADLKFVVERAMQRARAALPERYKDEV
jgi:hypothetical protein